MSMIMDFVSRVLCNKPPPVKSTHVGSLTFKPKKHKKRTHMTKIFNRRIRKRKRIRNKSGQY